MLFSNQFKSSKWAPVFVLNLKYWYLSKMISFLKCPLVPTFLLLIKTRRWDQKNGNIFSQGPIHPFIFFHMPVRILSLISINTTEGHMWNCIIFYFFYFLKKKNWNEMRWDRNLVLNNEMRMNDMKNEALHLIMMMVKHCTKKTKKLFTKKK